MIISFSTRFSAVGEVRIQVFFPSFSISREHRGFEVQGRGKWASAHPPLIVNNERISEERGDEI